LHVGCADDPHTKVKLNKQTLLHSKIKGVAQELYGIDLSTVGIKLLGEKGYKNLAVANVETMVNQSPFGSIKFDIVVAGETLEHLMNPGLFLNGAKQLLAKSVSSRLLITVPNAYCGYRFLYTLLTGKEAVNPDHVSYYSAKTLIKLVTTSGYDLDDISYYPANESRNDLNHGLFRILWWADCLAYWLQPALGDGVMALFKIAPDPIPGSRSDVLEHHS